jgi:hypothetical protein
MEQSPEELARRRLVKKFFAFLEPKISLPHTQARAT